MNTNFLTYIPVFVIVFLIFFATGVMKAKKAEKKQDQKNWEEGQRRRAQTEEDAAWRANKNMPMK